MVPFLKASAEEQARQTKAVHENLKRSQTTLAVNDDQDEYGRTASDSQIAATR
jgi:hypothetical protein